MDLVSFFVYELTTGVLRVKPIVAKSFSRLRNVDVDVTVDKFQHQQALLTEVENDPPVIH